MEELSADDLQQLEEQLYSQIHHSNSLETQKTNEDETQNQTKNIENIETANTSKFLAKRYWTNKVGVESAGGANIEVQNKFNKSNNNIKSTPPPPQKKPQDAVKPTHHNPHNNNNSKNKNKKIRNPFAQPQGAAYHNKHGAPQTKQHNLFGNPLAEKMQKIQRISQFHNKKQKADNARAKLLVKPKVIETISLDDDEDNEDDEIVVVPLPPVPVFSIEDSDEEMPAAVEDTITPTKALPENSSRCASPASVMSHDDFIGQGDRHRLLNVSSNTADSFLAQESRSNDDDVECIGTFVKPQASIMKTKDKVPGKQDYRVGGAEFRAVDVYESESDIVSDGVYSKGSTKTPITANITALNVSDNSEEDDDLDDISQNPTKTKRLRKRRASTSQRSAELIDSDDNDGVSESGVPFIYRGQALDNQKSKKKRKRLSTGRMSDSEFVATLNSLAKGDEENHAVVNSESDSRDNDQMPTARDIAEQVLNAAQSSSRVEPEIIEIPSTSSAAAALQTDEAIPAGAADDIEKILSKITEFQQKKSQEEDALHADSDGEPNVSAESHILAASDVSTTVANFDRSTLETKEENSDDDEKIKYYIGYSPANSDCISDGFGWNEEMRRFYNYTWGGEYFREETIFRSMKRNPHLWRISNVDRFPMQMRGKREKCMNCFTFGHSRSKCPKPKRPLVCYMCGQSGHLEPRCPNTRCLRCGSETMSFVPSCKKCMYWNNRICPICKLRGHSLNDCPDKWRRYHSTTKPNEFPNPNVVYKRRVCCFCGKFGHLSEECRQAVHRTEYPLIASEIKSFEKSYDDVLQRSPYPAPGLQCRLLFDPKLIVNFTLAEKTTRFQAYGRFLKHVGLGRSIGVKNDNSRQRNIISPAAVVVTGQKSPQKRPLFVETAQANTTNEMTQEANLANKSANKATATVTTNSAQAASTSTANMPPPPAPLLPSPMDFDSDSNYSFSEHFEVSSTQKDPQPTTAKPKPATLEPMPDFIALGGGDRYKATTEEDTVETGISARFVEAHSDDDDDTGVEADVSSVSNQQKPCQAKIFIDNERYRYFQSKEGQVYLCKVLPEHELTGSLEKTSAGFALFLTGLPKNQEKFQQALLQKYEELNNAKQQQQIDMQVPKNVPALIRFLRDSINQLYSNLGSATDLYKRLYDLEKLQTKVRAKSADRVRRTLNMIFLGQAGLLNGDAHFGTLLKALNTLLCDFGSNEKTPQKMREEINASWRMLFTPYDHKRYANLLAIYIQLPPMKRNRLPALQIDAKVLGNSVLDVTLTKEQKKRLASNAQIKTETATAAEEESMDSSMLLLNVFVPGQGDDNPNSNQTNKDEANAENVPTSSNATQHAAEEQQQTETTNKPPTNETNSNENSPHSNEPSNSQNTALPAEKEVSSSAMDHPFCLILLEEIEKSSKIHETGARVEAAKAPSRFWSCKSQEYLLEIIEFARISNSQNLDRLEEIYKQAAQGRLSFTNHGDVLKIFNRTVKK